LKTTKKTRKPSNFVLCRDESDDDDEDWAENIRPKTAPEIEYKTPMWKNILVSTFLLVDFLGVPKNKTQSFVFIGV
jgi:hypothetical protein